MEQGEKVKDEQKKEEPKKEDLGKTKEEDKKKTKDQKKEEQKKEEQNKDEQTKKTNDRKEDKEKQKTKEQRKKEQEQKTKEAKKKKDARKEPHRKEFQAKRKAEVKERKIHDAAGGLKRARAEGDGLRRAAVSSLHSVVLPINGSAIEVFRGAAIVTTSRVHHGGASNDYEQTWDLREVDCDPVTSPADETFESDSPWEFPLTPESAPAETPAGTPERTFCWWEWLGEGKCEEWHWSPHKGWARKGGTWWQENTNGPWRQVSSV